jgi:ABC-type tungstate transport system permease subunit
LSKILRSASEVTEERIDMRNEEHTAEGIIEISQLRFGSDKIETTKVEINQGDSGGGNKREKKQWHEKERKERGKRWTY